MAKKKHETPRIVLRRTQAPSQLGGSLGNYLPPGAQYEYKPPSVFVQYRALTIVFIAVLATALIYGLLMHRHRVDAPPTDVPVQAPQAEPVYVEPVTPH